ncbi:MAG: hypothetical protein HY842_15965 [Bacteroidetes bacterium]|nr:hypothetical protein [Bacteroidota bacterium]
MIYDLRFTIYDWGRSWFFLGGFALMLSACKNEPRHVTPAFYHWQTHLQLTENERLYLDSLGVKKLYVKFFDVDWDEASRQPVPLAIVEIDTARLDGLEIVPTVFITNRTFLNLKLEGTEALASRIFQKINALYPAPHREIQFDCDWTEQTRDKFFALLEHFKKQMTTSPLTSHSSRLSATIRLHQLKFFEKTGVPPVDRGMLMCYNMGDLEAWETENSILDLETAKKYLPGGKSNYPLPLDVALPCFRWGVLFRDREMIRLINNLSGADLEDTLRFSNTAANRCEVKKSTYLQGHYLYAGDQIRLEGVSPEALKLAAHLLNKVCARPEAPVAFSHLDTAPVRLFPKGKMLEVIEQF